MNQRLLVLGASAGIGRAVAERSVKRGAAVAVAARRKERLDDIVGATALPCDVRDPEACAAVVAGAVDALGGLDALVVAAGASPLSRLAGADAQHWRTVVDTNLVGAALVTRAAIPHLEATGGRAIYMTVTSPGRPWPWLVPYFASKAGMDEMIRGWRAEHPGVGFTSVSVGPTASEFATGWDDEAAGAAFTEWQARGHLSSFEVMTAEQVADEILAVLASPVRIDELKLMPH